MASDSSSRHAGPVRRQLRQRIVAFSLIELLVVIGLVALLLALLLPALNGARRAAQAAACMSNMRQIGTAHWAYMGDHNGQMVDVGLAHGGAHADEDRTWLNSLQDYYGNYRESGEGKDINARSPLDDSPHWGPAPEGEPIPGGDSDQRRRTSYGLNDYLTTAAATREERHTRLSQIPNPSATVHVMIMSFGADDDLGISGEYAGADHAHCTNWFRHFGAPAYARAATQVQTNAVSGDLGTPSAVSNWGYLDGSVKQRAFSELGEGPDRNSFNPDVRP